MSESAFIKVMFYYMACSFRVFDDGSMMFGVKMENSPNIFMSLSDDGPTQKLLCSKNCGAQYTRLSATRLESLSFSSFQTRLTTFEWFSVQQSKEGKDYKINLIFTEFSHKFL